MLDRRSRAACRRRPLAVFENALYRLDRRPTAPEPGAGRSTGNLPTCRSGSRDFIPKGETLTLTYTVTVTDSQGATSDADRHGDDHRHRRARGGLDRDTRPAPPPGGLWSDQSNWETGTVPTASDDAIIITDQLDGLTPSYPVTINAPAFAKSLTMNDFGTSPPELINQSTLTIGGAVTLERRFDHRKFGNHHRRRPDGGARSQRAAEFRHAHA